MQLRRLTDGKTEIQSVVDVEQGEWIAISVGPNARHLRCKPREQPYCISLPLSFCLGEKAERPTTACEALRERDKALATEARAAARQLSQ